MINVKNLDLRDNHNKKLSDFKRKTTGRGIRGELVGCTGEMVILKVTNDEREIHGLPTNYAFLPAEECSFDGTTKTGNPAS